MLTRAVCNRRAMRTIGERIRQAREYRGLSGEELAKDAGYKTQSGIGNLENRATGRGGFRLNKIAEVLDFPVEWFLNGPDLDDLSAIDPRTQQQPRTLAANPYAITPHQRATALLERLNDAGLLKAIEYLELLETKYSRNSTDGAGDPVPAQAQGGRR